jgi:hypothetical protein
VAEATAGSPRTLLRNTAVCRGLLADSPSVRPKYFLFSGTVHFDGGNKKSGINRRFFPFGNNVY